MSWARAPRPREESWAAQPGALNPTNYLAVSESRLWFNKSVSLTDTHVVSPTIVNSFLFSYNHTNGPVAPIYPTKSLADLGVKMYNDKQPQYYLTVAGYYNRQGDFNKLIKNIRKNIELEPQNPEAHYRLATYSWDKASRDFRLSGLGDVALLKFELSLERRAQLRIDLVERVEFLLLLRG